MNRRFLNTGIFVIGIGIIASLAITSLHQHRSKTPVRLFAGFDVSDSNRAHLGQMLAILLSIVHRMQPGRDRVACFSTETTTREWFDDTIPHHASDLQKIARRELALQPLKPGTNTASFFQTTAAAMHAAGLAQPMVCVFFGDGDEDILTPAQADQIMASSANAIAANPRAYVVFVGLSSPHWLHIKALFAPLKDRLILVPISRTTPTRIAQVIDLARTPAGKE